MAALTSKIGGFKGFITSDVMFVVIGAVFLTPITLGIVAGLGGKIPGIGNNITLILLIASIVVFLLAGAVGEMIKGKLRPVLLGISIGLLFNAFTSTQVGNRLVNRLRPGASSSG